jgi:hypothetical protein
MARRLNAHPPDAVLARKRCVDGEAGSVKTHLMTVCTCLLTGFVATAVAQPAPAAARFAVSRAASGIQVDGVLDEDAWAGATVIPLDYEWLPGDNVAPPVRTDALITYDDRNLYIAFRAYDPDPSEIRAHLMDRDSIDTFVQDDHVTILIDAFNDERRAFQFRVNPLGVQADAVFSDVDGIEDFSWDAIWDSAGRVTAEGYELEVAIPLNQLRFPRSTEPMTWGISLGRSYPRSLRHRISSNPRDRGRACVLCQVNKVIGFENLQPGRNVEIDPTVTAGRTDTRPDLPGGSLEKAEQNLEPGISLRWGVTPNVSLNATVNPDFSQIEADVAQLAINERFALFFAEKRPFFLEGIDYFATPISAVFTRTVVDPSWGGKVTAKSGRNLAGAFVTADWVNSLTLPSNQSSSSASLDDDVTAGVLRYRRDVGSGSTVGVLYAGRESADYHNRVGGLDGFFRLTETDSVTFQYLRSDTRYPDEVVRLHDQPEGAFAGNALTAQYQHGGRHWFWQGIYEDLDDGFRADSGFVPQVDVRNLVGTVSRTFWGTRDDWHTQINVGGHAVRTEDHQGRLTGQDLGINGRVAGPLQTAAGANYTRAKLLFGGVMYEHLDRLGFNFQIQPSGAYRITLNGTYADTVDFANNRPAVVLQLRPAVELKLGRHVNAQFDHTLRTLEAEGERIFRADLTQLRLVYQFSVRSFVRGILQYQHVTRNPAMYSAPVSPETRTLFTQFLYSYKLNPQTVLFLGYSDNRLGMQAFALTQTDRTFFVKIGYAWLM